MTSPDFNANKPNELGKDGYLTARQVDDIHHNADTDLRTESIHHRIGRGATQAAAGDHTHDGQNSPQLLSGVITGSKTTATASVIAQILAELVKLGTTDNTSA